ncbi:MAG: asparagine synthetase A [Candidatus Micrarchaeota archaeon]|nr:asparagine synthetase A [Candidatus Micrarchaeota archaeon]
MDRTKRKAYLKITSEALRFCTGYFHENGFTQLMPVVLSPITDPLGPDPGSSVIKTGEIEYLGQRLCLTQSMILHKQIAVKEGVEKLFILSPNVRLEHPRRAESGKHLFEFTQLDFEIAHARMADVFSLMEGLMCGVARHVSRECAGELALLGRRLLEFSAPFRRYTTTELAAQFGEDWELPASLAHASPFWAISHKREFYDKDDPEQPGMFLNYDMVYPEGFGEALSGAEREWEYEKIARKIDAHGLDRGRYAAYLAHAREGLVPSAGGGFGIERLSRFLSGAPHVGDVQLFRRVPGEEVVA